MTIATHFLVDLADDAVVIRSVVRKLSPASQVSLAQRAQRVGKRASEAQVRVSSWISSWIKIDGLSVPGPLSSYLRALYRAMWGEP